MNHQLRGCWLCSCGGEKKKRKENKPERQSSCADTRHTAVAHTHTPSCRFLSFLLYKGNGIMKRSWLTCTWWKVISTWVRCSTKTCWLGGLLGWRQQPFQHGGLDILLRARSRLLVAPSHSPFFSHSLSHQRVHESSASKHARRWASLWREQLVCSRGKACGYFKAPFWVWLPDPYESASGCLRVHVCLFTGNILLIFKCPFSALKEGLWASFQWIRRMFLQQTSSSASLLSIWSYGSLTAS